MGVLPSGLVSLPTRAKREAQAVWKRSEDMRKTVGGFVTDAHRARISKLRRSVGFAARAHLAERRGFRPDTVFMVTATYTDGAAWRPLHVKRWLDNIRAWCKRRGYACRYVWVAELQKRGAIHYHVALWLPSEAYLPDSDACGWWPHGSTRTERARAAVPYLMKYLSKCAAPGSFSLPDGARMYGVGGLEHSMRRAARWLRYPAFIKSRADINDQWTRPATGGGWADPDGNVIPSEFVRTWLGDQYGLLRVADYGRPFDAVGPFSWLTARPAQE